MLERTFFSLRYALPGYTFILIIVLVAYPELEKFLFQIEDVAMVSAFLAFLSLLGGGALGFLISQVWYAFYHRCRRGRYGMVPKTIEFLRKEYGLIKDNQHEVVFFDYVHSLADEKRVAYTQRRFDLMHTCGSTLVSTLIGSIFGLFIRIGYLSTHTPLKEAIKSLSELSPSMPKITTYDLGVILLVALLLFFLCKTLRHVGTEQSMMADVSIKEAVSSGKLSYGKARRDFRDDYFIVRFFLDTGALIALSGLKDSNLQVFKNRIEESKSELSVTHIQVDEIVDEEYAKKLQSYQQKIEKALDSLKSKEINVRLEDTKIAVCGVSRSGYAVVANEEIEKLYDELRNEIDECEKVKGKTKHLLNLDCDAATAVSSLNHDFFITCDRCLFDSWGKVISKHRMLKEQFKVPEVIYTRPNSKEVAKRVLGLLS